MNFQSINYTAINNTIDFDVHSNSNAQLCKKIKLEFFRRDEIEKQHPEPIDSKIQAKNVFSIAANDSSYLRLTRVDDKGKICSTNDNSNITFLHLHTFFGKLRTELAESFIKLSFLQVPQFCHFIHRAEHIYLFH